MSTSSVSLQPLCGSQSSDVNDETGSLKGLDLNHFNEGETGNSSVYYLCDNVNHHQIREDRFLHASDGNNGASLRNNIESHSPISQLSSQCGGGGPSRMGNAFNAQDLTMMVSQPKIPRPPNAFMIFANEWRKKLALRYPHESNKEISCRLGTMWKGLEKELKEKYFSLAREADAEHKRKYPDYVYNPKEARIRKAMRAQAAKRGLYTRSNSALLAGQSRPTINAMLNPKQMLGKLTLDLDVQERRAAIRDQVERGMSMGSMVDHNLMETVTGNQEYGFLSEPVTFDPHGQWLIPPGVPSSSFLPTFMNKDSSKVSQIWPMQPLEDLLKHRPDRERGTSDSSPGGEETLSLEASDHDVSKDGPGFTLHLKQEPCMGVAPYEITREEMENLRKSPDEDCKDSHIENHDNHSDLCGSERHKISPVWGPHVNPQYPGVPSGWGPMYYFNAGPPINQGLSGMPCGYYDYYNYVANGENIHSYVSQGSATQPETLYTTILHSGLSGDQAEVHIDPDASQVQEVTHTDDSMVGVGLAIANHMMEGHDDHILSSRDN